MELIIIALSVIVIVQAIREWRRKHPRIVEPIDAYIVEFDGKGHMETVRRLKLDEWPDEISDGR